VLAQGRDKVRSARFGFLCTTALFCAGAIATPGAFAQTAPAAGNSAASASQTEEITVTAQRRNEHLEDVPVSVSALSSDALQNSGTSAMADLGNVVPALHVDTSGAFFQPSIRGVGTAIAGTGASANVAMYLDGVYRPDALSGNIDFLDIDNVQVLKGPQGTLFGRNATGGAILVTTRGPLFEPQTSARFGYGSFNTFEGSLFVTDKITDNIAGSISVGAINSQGWIHNTLTNTDANPINNVSGRIKFLFQPSNTWSTLLTLDAFSIDDPTDYAVASYKGYSNAAFFGVPLSIDTPRETNVQGPIEHTARGAGFSLRNQDDLGWADLTSITAAHWNRGREYTNELAAPFPTNGTPPSTPAVQLIVDNADWNYTAQTYTQEFDLAHSGAGPLDWVGGLFFYYDKQKYSPFNLGFYGALGPGGIFTMTPPPYPSSAYLNTGDEPLSAFAATSISYAGFADVTYNLNNWHFTLGGRYSIDRAEVDFTSYPQIGNGFTSVSLSNSKDFYAFTPRAVVRYSLTPDSNIYLSYSEGTKSGLFNGSGYLAQRNAVNPERINATELGYKIQGHGWRFETAAFDYNYRDLQVATYIGGAAFFQNAPRAEIYGGEANWHAALTPSFTVDLGLSYTHARYTDFTNAALQTFSPVFGVTNSNTDVSGGPMQRTPSFSGTLGLNYDTEVAGGDLDLNASYSYRTKTSFDFADTLTQQGYGLLNLRAAWTPRNSRWSFAITGNNVTDEVYLTQVLPNAGGFGAVYGEPANYMFQITYSN
jgi:iron complex outermembrane receptor protein